METINFLLLFVIDHSFETKNYLILNLTVRVRLLTKIQLTLMMILLIKKLTRRLWMLPVLLLLQGITAKQRQRVALQTFYLYTVLCPRPQHGKQKALSVSCYHSFLYPVTFVCNEFYRPILNEWQNIFSFFSQS